MGEFGEKASMGNSAPAPDEEVTDDQKDGVTFANIEDLCLVFLYCYETGSELKRNQAAVPGVNWVQWGPEDIKAWNLVKFFRNMFGHFKDSTLHEGTSDSTTLDE